MTKKEKTLAFLFAREEDTNAVFSTVSGAEEIDARVDLPKIDGVASRNRVGVRGYHCGIRQ